MTVHKAFFRLLILAILLVISAQPAWLQESDEDAPATLEHYAGTWQDAIAELETAGVIPTGGTLIFYEDRAFFSGQGSFFTSLASGQPRADIVMAGEIAFTSGVDDNRETCTLLSRMVMHPTDNYATHFLDIGLDSVGTGYVLDRYGERSDDIAVEILATDVDLLEPHHVLFLAINDSLTVYLDGELVLEDFAIGDRSGTYGIGLRSQSVGARCEGTQIWAYEVPVTEPGVCEITASGTVNRRAGPGTDFEQAGTLSAQAVSRAVAQTTGSAGYIWWQLEDGSWVRDDIVNARGDCRTLPQPGESVAEDAATQEPAPTEAATDSTGETGTIAERVQALANADFDCSVRTDQANFASVRVGPGINRTAMLFLPAARDFPVLGQAAANDGALWWKLDKERVVSQIDAAELWVAQSQVDPTGDCDLVPFVEPPPVIEIVTVTDTLPPDGSWTYDPTTITVQCPSGSAVIESEAPTETVYLDFAADGTSLDWEGLHFSRVEPGVYTAQDYGIVEGDRFDLQFTLRIASASRIVLAATTDYEGCNLVMRAEFTR